MNVVDIGIPGVDQIPPGTHLCALYSGSAERDDILFPFLRQGLQHGDTCLCYIDGLEPGAVRARAVGEAGVAEPPADRFDVRPASEVYLQSGKFSVEHMTSVLSDSLDEVVAQGRGLLRATGEMPWPGVLSQPHGADDFFVYEAALNDVVDRRPAIFMCMYDLQRFGLDLLVAVLKTHPVVLLDQMVLDNPHFPGRARYDAEVAPTDTPPLGAAAAREPDPWPSLTPSELRIAGFVAKGLTNKDIAQKLCVSPHTVDAHLKHIFTKLDIHSRVELTVLAMQHRTPPG
ncbi:MULTISPECIES: MEDS domain-containing protein [unclassified Nocardioides]|uniref:MEDS domain-containing protein n=1 Tax=unclassified Nocardioides TaxID=2615069 RepID=UPI0009F0B2A9|nr:MULTISPECIES: MEDS domain-containing protein [unclassified Nocardioides]GAW48670.1 Transcriptional regulator, LuxR family [Nocardioides sp. PD653-B2]GAW54231.1 Transcriptional regulator, LuxR family [Nocardioides sp. PD653]